MRVGQSSTITMNIDVKKQNKKRERRATNELRMEKETQQKKAHHLQKLK